MHKKNIHHRHLIYDDHICLKRVLCISLKLYGVTLPLFLRHSRKLQKTVNGLRLISCRFCHSLCSPSCRRCQAKLRTFAFKKADNGIDRCCFSGSRTSCQYKKTVGRSFPHSFFLHFIKDCTCLLFNLRNSFFCAFFIFRTGNIQLTQHSCRIQLQIIMLAGVHDGFFFPLF